MSVKKTTAAQFKRLLPALQHLALFPRADHAHVCTARFCSLAQTEAIMAELAGAVKHWDEEALAAAAKKFRVKVPAFKPLPLKAAPAARVAASAIAVLAECTQRRGRHPAPAAVVRPAAVPMHLEAGVPTLAWLKAQGLDAVTIHTYQVEVSPAVAAAWLKFNQGNRVPAKTKVRRFTEAMKAGRWTLNGETVKFSTSGRLLDGQSRLMAIVAAGVPVRLEVRAGLADVAQESMDTGELRKGSHTLEMMGENYPGVLASALKLAYFHERGWLGGIPFGVSRVLENSAIKPLLERHAGLRRSVGWVVSAGFKSKALLPQSEAVFLHYLCGLADAKLRDAFFEALVDGVGLTKVSPVYHLRERLLESRRQIGRHNQAERFGLVFKAWNLARAGAPVSHLAFRMSGPSAEKFPALAGLAVKGKAAA